MSNKPYTIDQVKEMINKDIKFHILISEYPSSDNEDVERYISISNYNYPCLLSNKDNKLVCHIDDFSYNFEDENKKSYQVVEQENSKYILVDKNFIYKNIDTLELDKNGCISNVPFEEALMDELNFGRVKVVI